MIVLLPKPLDERARRILTLVEKPRMMSMNAAVTVVDAAMSGIGCIEGEMRKRIQEEQDAESRRNSGPIMDEARPQRGLDKNLDA